MPQPFYAYCPNPECAHRQGLEGVEWEQRPYAVLTENAATPGQTCPHCHTEMRATCPKCGKALLNAPQSFCPACGASLFQVETVVACRVCGRPVTVSTLGCQEVPVCSEHCLRDLIKQQVKVCDQCGSRFMADPHLREAPEEREPSRGTGPRGGQPLGDFCSNACRAQFLAALKS